jgi:hypothetical protein
MIILKLNEKKRARAEHLKAARPKMAREPVSVFWNTGNMAWAPKKVNLYGKGNRPLAPSGRKKECQAP